MSEEGKAAFLVDASSDPAIVKVDGRVNFSNSGPLRDFFDRVISRGKEEFVVDFRDCTGMDSTFLGILAGVALELRKKDPPGKILLCRLGERNFELIRNLGLHRIMDVDAGKHDFENEPHTLSGESEESQKEKARRVLEAHENLVEADEENRGKFQDVISYLKDQVESR